MRQQSRLSTVLGLACLLIALCAMPGYAYSAAPRDDAAARDVAPVDINKATAEVLTSIPGVGQATAQRIVDWRGENGPFRRVEDLMKIKGIGEKSFAKIRPYVKVSKGR